MSQLLKLLIVDDEKVIRLNFRAMLEDLGYQVIEASNGKEGLEAFERERPDLVLTDLRMPVLDGRAMIAKLHERNPETPVIVISGTGTLRDAVDSLRLGAWDYILKPIAMPDLEGLDIIIKRALEKATLKKENRIYREHLEELVRERSEELRESETKMRSILDNIGIGVALLSTGMEILDLNQKMKQWFPDVNPAEHPLCYKSFHEPTIDRPCNYCPAVMTLYDGLVHESTSETKYKKTNRNYRIISSPLLNKKGEMIAIIELVEDITERLSLESQFRQSQKMESIGRLAGGVAHDFNNMLSIIIGYTELTMLKMEQDHPFFNNLQEIRKAADKSADLTRQLLAFARKQTVIPRSLDLNQTVEGMLKMLRRLIGENIKLIWLPEAWPCPVKIDPSQIDQILANLCVNARDAISGVGQITLETRLVTFDESNISNFPLSVPGDYVMLSVSDNGCGMNNEIMEKLFEPFFTTKESGKGTGLGLATVYGIVKQNAGFIKVYSDTGTGSTFSIYLPRHTIPDERPSKDSLVDSLAKGNETILLVEDEDAILNLCKLMLENLGYRVLAALTPGEAIHIAEADPTKIKLVITDIIMPEMNGRDLLKGLLSICPGIKHIFISGYTGDIIADHNLLDGEINFIQKPFTIQTLAAKVHEVLHEK